MILSTKDCFCGYEEYLINFFKSFFTAIFCKRMKRDKSWSSFVIESSSLWKRSNLRLRRQSDTEDTGCSLSGRNSVSDLMKRLHFFFNVDKRREISPTLEKTNNDAKSIWSLKFLYRVRSSFFCCSVRLVAELSLEEASSNPEVASLMSDFRRL